MQRSSIRLRLIAAGGAAVLVSLALAALGLDQLFERHVERRALAELSVDLDQLAAGLARDADGAAVVAQPPTDPRYTQPLSGLYWQVGTGADRVRSRSLWDGALDPPSGKAAPGGDGAPHEIQLRGPRGEALLVLERRLTLPRRFGDQTVRLAVAMDRAELRDATRAFVADLAPYLGLLGIVLVAAGGLQVIVGLRPLAAVGARVAAVRSGAARRLGADFPDEVRPLAVEVDALIAAREAEIARARSRAADLAHGLKTPLQALIGEADRLRAKGETAAADGIEEVAEAMRRHVDRELARARIAAAGPVAATDPAAVLERLMAVMRRTPDGARVAWSIRSPGGLRARIDADDLTEALGALLENAARHATSRVEVAIERRGVAIGVRIRDDGPGIPADRLAELKGRGARLDLAGPGTGLGLSIATEIVEAVGGSLLLGTASPGLEVLLTLPASGGGSISAA